MDYSAASALPDTVHNSQQPSNRPALTHIERKHLLSPHHELAVEARLTLHIVHALFADESMQPLSPVHLMRHSSEQAVAVSFHGVHHQLLRPQRLGVLRIPLGALGDLSLSALLLTAGTWSSALLSLLVVHQ